MTALSIFAWNIHGLRDSYHDPYLTDSFAAYDILFLSETWVRATFHAAHTPPGFTVLSSNYPDQEVGPTRGGIALYYRSTLPVTTLFHAASTWKSTIWIRLHDAIFGFAYLPPTNSNFIPHWELEPLEHFLTQAEHYQNLYPGHSICLLGDLNARRNLPPDTRWNSRGHILDNTEDWIIHASDYTHVTNQLDRSCVDYILLSPEASRRSLSCTTLPFIDLSDHAPILLTLSTTPDPPPAPPLPLPHIRPPPIPHPTPLDIQERSLTATIPPAPSPPSSFTYRPDTTKLHQLRLQYQLALAAHRRRPNDHTQALFKHARNAVKGERKKLKHARKAALDRYWDSLSPKEWTAQVKPILRGPQATAIDASGPALAAHYQSLLNANADDIPPYTGTAPHHHLFDTPFTLPELQTALSKLNNSTTGEDRVSTHQIRQIPPEDLLHHLNETIRTGEVPTTWRRSILVAIPKTSDTSLPENTRGIALQSVYRKLFTTLLLTRLQDYL
ncbi:DNase I-like protein, partial [Ascobolus immersus RN42]